MFDLECVPQFIFEIRGKICAMSNTLLYGHYYLLGIKGVYELHNDPEITFFTFKTNRSCLSLAEKCAAFTSYAKIHPTYHRRKRYLKSTQPSVFLDA